MGVYPLAALFFLSGTVETNKEKNELFMENLNPDPLGGVDANGLVWASQNFSGWGFMPWTSTYLHEFLP